MKLKSERQKRSFMGRALSVVPERTVALLTAILVFLNSGCFNVDGGSSGTETGGKVSLRGRVLDKESSPVPGVVAKLTLTGLSDTTDAYGTYFLYQDSIPNSNSMSPLDTLVFLQGGQRVAILEITKWTDTLPDIKLTQRTFSGVFAATDTAIKKVEAVLSGTGIPADSPVVKEFFYNKPVNEYSGFILFPKTPKMLRLIRVTIGSANSSRNSTAINKSTFWMPANN
jgi:hypothetical protein